VLDDRHEAFIQRSPRFGDQFAGAFGLPAVDGTYRVGARADRAACSRQDLFPGGVPSLEPPVEIASETVEIHRRAAQAPAT
jgi:hypothetical protein